MEGATSGRRQAAKHFEAAAEINGAREPLDQNLAAGWQLRGRTSGLLGKHDAAIEQLTRAMRLSPLDPEAHVLESAMAFAHLFQGRYARRSC